MATKEEVLAAIEKVQALQADAPMMVVKLAYNLSMILPYADGLALQASLERAMKYQKEWSAASKITPFEEGDIEISRMSTHHYKMIQMAMLLDISEDELTKTIKQEEIEIPF